MAEQTNAVLTVVEAGNLLRISRGLAYQMAKQGKLPTVRLGRRVLVPRAALEQLLAPKSTDPLEGDMA